MKQQIRKALNRVGFDIIRYRDPEHLQDHRLPSRIDVLDLVIHKVSSSVPDFFFVQIGANDGVCVDPIRKYVIKSHWRGLLVEPVPHLFRKLVENYRDETELVFENVAIAPQDGVMSLYTVDGVAPDFYMYGLASFDKNHLRKYLPKNFPIKELKVPTLSLATLLSKHSVTKIDLLQIDVEGYDYEIIKMIDFETIKPKIINFENEHINKIDLSECYGLLAAHGYDLATSGADTIAFLQRAFDC
ncbi:MAG: FkbM family methyltransferase [Isosphaeraceae bacterium]